LKKIAILQSNYIPWKGYFDIMNRVDEFVIYDDAQYTKRDWRNRNLIKTIDGAKWLTIPVEVKDKYKQIIRETKVSGNNWTNKHLKIIKHNYSRAEHFTEITEWLIKLYMQCENEIFLSDINLLLIREIAGYLGIKTKISFSSDYILEGDRSGKAMNICVQAGAKEYLTGPAAKSYLDIEAFNKEGIEVTWMDYSGYKEYPQLYPPFIHEVSIIDVMFNTGIDSVNYLNSF
jgi:WbqC-like protein family